MNNNDLNNLLKNSDTASLMSKLNEDDMKLFNSLLKDQDARQKFLSSEEAQKLLKMLGM